MTGAESIEQELRVILSRIRQDQFGGRDAPEVTLVDGSGVGDDGRLRGAFEVRICSRRGDKVLLHTEPLDGISNVRALRDTFASALSKVLANHGNWPR